MECILTTLHIKKYFKFQNFVIFHLLLGKQNSLSEFQCSYDFFKNLKYSGRFDRYIQVYTCKIDK